MKAKPPIFPPNRVFQNHWLNGMTETPESILATKEWRDAMNHCDTTDTKAVEARKNLVLGSLMQLKPGTHGARIYSESDQ